MKKIQQDKRVIWDYDYIQSQSDNYRLYALSDKQVQLLLTPMNVATWIKTRWVNVSSDLAPLQLVAESVEALMTPIDICAEIVNCIDNSEAVRDALRRFMNENGQGVVDSDKTLGANDGVNIVAGVPCDLDSLYGAAVALEDYTYNTAKDVIQHVTDTIIDWIAWLRIIDYIPIIGDAPILDDLNDLITQFRTFGVNALEVGYTQQIRQENICSIFELMCASCNLTPSGLAMVYTERAGLTVTPTSVYRSFVALLLGNFTDIAFTAAMQALIVASLSVGSKVITSVGLESLNAIARSGDADGDWEIFCNPCQPDCLDYFYDFSLNDGGWSAIGGLALYRVSDGAWGRSSLNNTVMYFASPSLPSINMDTIQLKGYTLLSECEYRIMIRKNFSGGDIGYYEGVGDFNVTIPLTDGVGITSIQVYIEKRGFDPNTELNPAITSVGLCNV